MRHSLILLAAFALSVLAACDDEDSGNRHHRSHHRGYQVSAAAGSIYVKKNDLMIRSDKTGTAAIHPDASLTIDDDDVDVSEDGRKALNGYRAAYKALAEDAIQLGLDGVDLGLSTMGEVMKGLLDGTADEAGKAADRRGKEIDARARGLCDRLAALRGAQQNVVERVPKFADYAVVGADEVKDCYEDNGSGKHRSDDKAAPSDPPELPDVPAVPDLPDVPKPPKPSKSYNFNVETGNWSIHQGSVVIPKSGGDEAVVGKDGSLRIGDATIDLSATAREALKRFNFNGRHVEDEGVGLGLAGADIALGALGGAIRNAFGADADRTERDLEHRSDAMNLRVQRLCGYLRDMRQAQQDAVAAAAAFTPYAVVSEKDVRDCGVGKDRSEHPKPAAGSLPDA